MAVVLPGALAADAAAQDYEPSFRPGDFDDRPIGAANEVMVLGTAHLA